MNEIFDINDSLKGYVIIRDGKTGEILVKKHNMILKDGKAALLKYLLRKSY